MSGLVGRGTRTLLAFGVAYKLDVASVLEIVLAAMCIARPSPAVGRLKRVAK